MNKVDLKSYAKINLCLDIVNKRLDGYHNLRSIMQTLDLCDELEIEKSQNIHIECNHPAVPLNESNLAYKAAKAIFQRAGFNGGARIKIRKNIPVAAGLAGGSSNAAAVLHGINILYNLNFTVAQLIHIAKGIGADVPYCLVGGTVLATGIGEKLNIISPINEYSIILVKPNIGVSTKQVYAKVDLNNLGSRPDIEKAIVAIEDNDLQGLLRSMGNVLEPITCSMIKEVPEIKNKMLEIGADGAHMCGSGPTVFAICSSKDKAEDICKYFKNVYSEVYLCKTI
ncbi:MAG: hypothetical protein APF76_15585 [Desulfitibacter sp. BRH_c19]|nr:MAG: hypothetical protein APF76_15585 [Desulfitibacter sp. BRH_c19]